ncbi:hypothetical protein OGAPHI_005930 [Ogataea philodendri]|uniref:Uncharacterized protein n=1 Tax=Ogataea philodendri TaxID=1378263 RepID=A0A9P8NYW7_9ASCO|nr:uncharacterized protein OGAPHI_005930 [Ogataea philodendri]KAH3661752.1 hypothetical protein OGAPHI_005930 [Ogataea philodendri]
MEGNRLAFSHRQLISLGNSSTGTDVRPLSTSVSNACSTETLELIVINLFCSTSSLNVTCCHSPQVPPMKVEFEDDMDAFLDRDDWILDCGWRWYKLEP